MNLSAVTIVQTHQQVASGLGKAADSRKGAPRIARVMQHAVADDEIEEPVTQRWPKQVHLGERGALEPMGGLEFLRQRQRIQANVRAQGAPVRDGQEIRELPGN